jgi:N6-adenosine-specific RNA methylase IME4/transcriptional regulator with XRE-family HTH domain
MPIFNWWVGKKGWSMDTRFKHIIPPLSADEYNQLEQNILRDGIREPLVMWGDTLIDGHNRLSIAQKHGIDYKTVSMCFPDDDAAKKWIIINQFGRRNLSLFERARLALELKPIIAEKAKENLTIAAEMTNTGLQKSVKAVNTQKELAAIAGVSHDTIAKVEKIETAPDVSAKVKSGELSINQGYQMIVREQRESSREEQRKQNGEKVSRLDNPLDAQGLFQTIVIDPPWDWGDEGDVNQMGRAKPDYSTMPIEDIEALPVGKIADENCHLYLWVTNRSLPKAFRLIEAWGFRYITCLTWVKPSFGMGNYFRGSTEQVLFAVKGSQPLKRHDVPTHFMADRGNGHSAKPDAFYDMVEGCSYAPFIDVFGRQERPGWSVWGESS